MQGLWNFYQVLVFSPMSTQYFIKRRYRELVKKTHPDCIDGKSGEAIRRINEAYGVLGNVRTRRRYDARLFRRIENGFHSAGSFSNVFIYERTKQAYEAYLKRIEKRKRRQDPNHD